jgi:hypothetical protein
MEKADNKGSAKAIARSQSKSAQENRQALMMALSY